jgi:hypothetical protein
MCTTNKKGMMTNPRCGGHLRVIASVHDVPAVQAILAHRAARPRGRPGPPLSETEDAQYD